VSSEPPPETVAQPSRKVPTAEAGLEGAPRAPAPPRVAIEGLEPSIDGGRFPIKRVAGESVVVEANVFADGHDVLRCVVLHRPSRESKWAESEMAPLGNDRWRGEFRVAELGTTLFTVEAWVDAFLTWRRDTQKKLAARQDVGAEILVGARLIREAAARSEGEDRRALELAAEAAGGEGPPASRAEAVLSDDVARILARYPDRRSAERLEPALRVTVERLRARSSAWYELFPRSAAPQPGRHGTLRDVAARLPYVASLGFDVLYLPPIHPIGRTHRKGRNNAPWSGTQDPGSPWAIGAEAGGHTAIHPELGTLEDFQHLVRRATELGIEIALDLAFQCSPDHPYVKEHPEWFRHRPDGTIQYAENPPKRYQDIYPFDFEGPAWRELWLELRRVVEVWVDRGVRIFRVDNPHTKPFAFWEWLIREVRSAHEDVIFLAEAFTRPKVMHRLAKLGFSQSYTYFTWRNTRAEITAYLTELTACEGREYFRPNLWPNTPDILPEFLQLGGRPAFLIRLVLAATLGANYGIYGPAFELCEAAPLQPGSEEYRDSEKYEIRSHDLDRPDSLRRFVARINAIRREHTALQANESLRFHEVDNDSLIAYTKRSLEDDDTVLTVVNLDPHHAHTGWVRLPASELGLEPKEVFQAHDILSGARYLWQGDRHFIELDPRVTPCHIVRIRRRVRTEHDFEYFL
jgi:starch synthase (maltosyl-transferring)